MPAPLEDIRVIEAAGPIAHYAGRLLADLGADVIKVEPPEGDPARRYPPLLPDVEAPEGSLPFLLLNANKRGVTLDVTREADRDTLVQLLRDADVLIHSWQPREQIALGLTDAVLEAANPRLIVAAVTGWGASGPRADWAYADIVGSAASGVMRLAGFPGGPPEQLPDLQGYHCASIQAAAGVLAALLHRDATGEGQRVDVSMQEALSMAQETAMQTSELLGTDRGRTGGLSALGLDLPGLGLHECGDGYVYLMAIGTAGAGFGGLLGLMVELGGAQDLLEEPYASFIAHSMNRNVIVELLNDPDRREQVQAILDHINEVVHAFARAHPKRTLYEAGQARRVLIGMISTPEDIAASPQLEARGWWLDLEDARRGRTWRYPGPPWQLRGTPASVRRPAPVLGEHNAEVLGGLETAPPAPAASGGARSRRNGARPLDGVKVLDLTWFGAGPIATRSLATLGADVVRVETAKRPDGLRIAAPRPPGATSLNVSGYYNNFNAEKRSVTIDLTTERGHELGMELVRWADLFMTNMTNRAVAKIGMDWATISEVNPGLVAMYQPMQGLTGPHAEFQGFGAVLSTICGASYLAGFEGNAPVGVGTNYPDYVVNPMHAVVALLAALRHQRATGAGQLIDMSQLESSVAAMAGPLFASMNGGPRYVRSGNRMSFAAPHGVFRVLGEDNWLAVACLDERQWHAFAEAIGRPELAADARFESLESRRAHEDQLERVIEDWSASQHGAAALETLQAAGVPSALVQRASEVLADPHLAAREYFVYLDHAEAGRRPYDGAGFRLSKADVQPRRAAPLLGEHTLEVATQILGLSSAEVADLVAEQVLA